MRAARAVVTSVMLKDAKPIPAVTAKTKVTAHTAHPAREVARWRVCQSPAAHDGMTSAARSAATPMARNSQPAMSLDPSDRANQPFVVMPTPASAKAAATRRIEATGRYDGVTASAVTVGSGVTGGSAKAAESAARNSSGISDSEDENSASGEAAASSFCRLAFFCRLRGLDGRARGAPIPALLG